MARYRVLLRCVGEAVVANGLKCLAGLIPFGERLYEIACEAHQRYKQACQMQEAVSQVEAMAQAPLDEVKAEVREVFAEIRAAASPDVAAQLAQPAVEKGLVDYLEHVPAAVRSSLRRPADPTGCSVPHSFSVQKPEEFLRFLPPRPPRFQPGDRVVGNWQLEELLGVGGFGEVWKARHPHFHNLEPVALKFCLDESSVRYLRHEAGLIDRMMAHSRLPGVVQLRNAYLENDPPCLEYEFINGGDLCGLLHQWQNMNPAKRIEQATQLIQRLAGILAPLHRLDPAIVHRDLKPANILMVRKESGKYDVKIGDFGIGGVSARQALAGASRGVSRGDLLSQSLRGSHTPLYASDEQMGGNDPDPRDDVHALGVMWFQMLVGDLSRRAGSDLDEELRELKVPEKLIRLVKLCVARAGRRWANAGELAENIGHLLGNDPARDVQEEEHEWDVSKLERRQSEEKLPDGEDLGVQDPENGTAGGGTITSSVGKYGLAAIRAMELVKKGLVSSPIEAWERAVTEVFPHRPASQKKGCPRGTFLGLCEDGLIKGIRRGNYTGSEKNKGYALAAVSKLRDNPSLAHDPTQLWAMVAGKKTPNHQMDVVISLWNNGLIVTPG